MVEGKVSHVPFQSFRWRMCALTIEWAGVQEFPDPPFVRVGKDEVPGSAKNESENLQKELRHIDWWEEKKGGDG